MYCIKMVVNSMKGHIIFLQLVNPLQQVHCVYIIIIYLVVYRVSNVRFNLVICLFSSVDL